MERLDCSATYVDVCWCQKHMFDASVKRLFTIPLALFKFLHAPAKLAICFVIKTISPTVRSRIGRPTDSTRLAS